MFSSGRSSPLGVPTELILMRWGQRCSSHKREDSHLCRRANRWILWSDIQETDCITKTLSNASRPRLKHPARPLETMVFVPELPGGQVFELHVIFHVRCRQNHCRRS